MSRPVVYRPHHAPGAVRFQSQQGELQFADTWSHWTMKVGAVQLPNGVREGLRDSFWGGGGVPEVTGLRSPASVVSVLIGVRLSMTAAGTSLRAPLWPRAPPEETAGEPGSARGAGAPGPCGVRTWRGRGQSRGAPRERLGHPSPSPLLGGHGRWLWWEQGRRGGKEPAERGPGEG